MTNKMKLGTKLILGFMLVAAIAAGIGLVGVQSLMTMGGHVHEIGEVRVPSLVALIDLTQGLERIVRSQRTLLNPQTVGEDRQRQLDNIRAARTQYREAWQQFQDLIITAEGRRNAQEINTHLESWIAENERFMSAFEGIEQTGIMNPEGLSRQLERFRGDHLLLLAQVNAAIRAGELIKDGDDHTACAFGRWLTAANINNAEFNATLARITEPHRIFHQAVGEIQTMLGQGDVKGAEHILETRIAPASLEFLGDRGLGALTVIVDHAQELCDAAYAHAMNVILPIQNQTFERIEQLVAFNESQSEDASAQATAAVTRSSTIMVSSLVAGVIIAIALGLFLTRSITGPINKVIADLSAGADQVLSASNQVSDSSQSMAEGASEQASSLEETSASLEEMSSMIIQNTDNANQSNKAAADATDAAKRGRSAMNRMSEAISKIKASSDETTGIIKTIDEIAFQTNLLALNAAVEAARAGDAGRGFAVVAEEVRNLAQRSATAARSTAQLIEGSQQQATEGVAVAHEVGDLLEQIGKGVEHVAQLISEVSAASNEQSQGIAQINTAMEQMNQVTQASAANAEESAAASEELSGQARELNNVVDRLRAIIGGNGAANSSHIESSRTTSTPRGNGYSSAKKRERRVLNPAGPPRLTARVSSGEKQIVSPEAVIPLDDTDIKGF